MIYFEINLEIWDTAGQERFQSMHPTYYYKAHACILVFDVTRKPTYVHLKAWYNELKLYCPDIPCVLVANKVDVDYMVTKKAFKFPSDNNLPFFFVSSADGTNVVKVSYTTNYNYTPTQHILCFYSFSLELCLCVFRFLKKQSVQL